VVSDVTQMAFNLNDNYLGFTHEQSFIGLCGAMAQGVEDRVGQVVKYAQVQMVSLG